MRRRPAEPLAFWVTGAFALLFAASLALLAALSWTVVRGAWPGPLVNLQIQGAPTCAEELGDHGAGRWLRLSGYPDAWQVPRDDVSGVMPDQRLGAVLLRDGRWFCTDAIQLQEPGRTSNLPARELGQWIEAFRGDLDRLQARARSGDTLAIDEFQRLNVLGSKVLVRLQLGAQTTSVPLESIRRVRPEAPSWTENTRLFLGTLRDQLASSPTSFASLTGTVLATLLATLLASPLALAAAIWLSEFSRPGPLTWWFRQSVQLLSGVPPVVFGAFGLAFLIRTAAPATVPDLASPSLLWASLTLALLALPTVTRQAHLALLQVPSTLREASLCAGASRLQTLRLIVLPTARRGLLGAVLMGAIQALAETAPLLLTGAVQLSGQPLVNGQAPWLHPGGGFEHLGTRIYHGIEQLPPGPLGSGAVALCCLLLALSSISLRTWAASLRRAESQP